MLIARKLTVVVLIIGLCHCPTGWAQSPAENVDAAIVAKIKEEGLQRSQVMETISYLTDVHGPRLTGSPATRKAGEWTQAKLTEWGLQNAQLESWGPFGRGWSLEGFSAKMVEPSFSPLIAYPKAWSPGTPKTVRGEPIYLDVSTEADLEKYRDKLLRAIVLISPPRPVKALFDAPARRQTDEALLALANADGSAPRGGRGGGPRGPGGPGGERPTMPPDPASPDANPPARAATTPPANVPAATPAAAPANTPAATPAANSPAANAAANGQPARPGTESRSTQQLQTEKWQLAYDAGAAVVLEPGTGDGGTVFVSSARMPRQRESSAGERPAEAGNNPFNRGPRPWATDAPEIVPQVVVAVEHYNRIIRMLQKGQHPQLEIDIASRYHTEDLNSFNVIAEIPGTDLKDEIVMLGAHFDSWHSGTGATDNAIGCGVALEAVRILQAIGAKPRRTIRIALWTGEEQGLLGSRAYVNEHFGRAITPERSGGPTSPTPEARAGAASGAANAPNASTEKTTAATDADQPAPKEPAANQPAPSGQPGGPPEGQTPRERPRSKYELKPAHQNLAAYFNLDNGTGKIRGIYLQGNEQVRPVFRAWLKPFAEMGASTITPSYTGGTDHQSFDGVGLPGFQFIQDPLEYNTRTHHSSMDVYDRIQEDDAKQASIIMASFVYHAAMRDEKLPRKPLDGEIINSP